MSVSNEDISMIREAELLILNEGTNFQGALFSTVTMMDQKTHL